MTGPVRLETTDTESQRRIIYDTSQASAVLFAHVSYKLVDAKLVLAVATVMYPKTQRLMQFRSKPQNTNPLDDGNAIYRKIFTYRSETIARDRVHQSLADGLLLQGEGSLRKSPDQPWKAEVSGRFDQTGHGRFQGPGRLMAMNGRTIRDCTVDLIQTSQAGT